MENHMHRVTVHINDESLVKLLQTKLHSINSECTFVIHIGTSEKRQIHGANFFPLKTQKISYSTSSVKINFSIAVYFTLECIVISS